jgi:regulator of replication initiation timing
MLSNMTSELELLRQQVVELKTENVEVKAENAKLRQIIEENTRRDAENTSLESGSLRPDS